MHAADVVATLLIASTVAGGLDSDSVGKDLLHASLQGVAAELLDFELNYQMGQPGIGIAHTVSEWPGPGHVFWTRYEEGVQRNMYRFYLDMMRAEPGDWPSFDLPEQPS